MRTFPEMWKVEFEACRPTLNAWKQSAYPQAELTAKHFREFLAERVEEITDLRLPR